MSDERDRMAGGRCATRQEAMAAFCGAFDSTIDKSA